MKPINTNRAQFLRDFLCDRLERQASSTRRVLAALAEGGQDYRPNPKGSSAFELAWHIVTGEILLLEAIARGTFAGIKSSGPLPGSVAAMIARYDEELPPTLAKVRALDGDRLAAGVAFAGSTKPLVLHIAFVLEHSIHHRGQLTAYLRAMGAVVPGVLGPSADERPRS